MASLTASASFVAMIALNLRLWSAQARVEAEPSNRFTGARHSRGDLPGTPVQRHGCETHSQTLEARARVFHDLRIGSKFLARLEHGRKEGLGFRPCFDGLGLSLGDVKLGTGHGLVNVVLGAHRVIIFVAKRRGLDGGFATTAPHVSSTKEGEGVLCYATTSFPWAIGPPNWRHQSAESFPPTLYDSNGIDEKLFCAGPLDPPQVAAGAHVITGAALGGDWWCEGMAAVATCGNWPSDSKLASSTSAESFPPPLLYDSNWGPPLPPWTPLKSRPGGWWGHHPFQMM